MYATGVCPFCMMAERLLRSKGVAEIEKILPIQGGPLNVELHPILNPFHGPAGLGHARQCCGTASNPNDLAVRPAGLAIKGD